MFWELGVSQQLKVEAGLESKESQLSLQMTQFRSFLWLSNKYAIVYMYHIFIHSSIDGHLINLINCCNKHWSACVFEHCDILRVYAQQWDCQVIGQFHFQFFKEPLYCSPQCLYQFIFPPIVPEASIFSTPSPACEIQKNCTDEPICSTGIEIQIQKMDMQTEGRRGSGRRIWRLGLACIHYHV